MGFEKIQDIWGTIKDRPLGEYLNFLNDEVTKSKEKKDVDELDRNAKIFAAASIGAFNFAQHITGEEDAQD